ncbi:nucleoside monophosphate kinase [Patescibacteria group bacterium]|nr:nucleoside monophosphate kinase [Patescibacteria group bacterium]
MNDIDTIIVMGRSGSGKGTQVALLKDYLTKTLPGTELFHFESGQHFRSFIKEDGYTNELMRDILGSGNLAPDFITEWFLVNALVNRLKKDDQILILDGFPRTVNQAMTLDSAMAYYQRSKVVVINVAVSDDVARERMKGRGRADDQDDVIERRIEWYNENVVPTIDYLKNHDLYTVYDIDGEQSVEGVHAAIIEVLSSLNNN